MKENKYEPQEVIYVNTEMYDEEETDTREKRIRRIQIILFLLFLLLFMLLIVFGVKTGDLVDKNNPYNPGGEISPSPTITASPTVSPTPTPSPTTTTSPTTSPTPSPTTTTSPTSTSNPTTNPTTSPKPTSDPSDLVKFHYSDTVGVGNGISIVNAVPTDDTIGKLLVGDKYYFDFNITATTNNRPVTYTIIATKDNGSTLSDSNIKVYLTKLNGGSETSLSSCFNNEKVKTYNQYSNFRYDYISGKAIYRETIPQRTSNYKASYRLRIWVSDSAVNWENKDYSLKINVYAVES